MPDARPIIPPEGSKITQLNGKLVVPDHPILPFIEGDGTGRDIWRASVKVFDAAVAKAYGGKRKIAWAEVYAGEKAFKQFGNWLPDETIEAFREYLIGIKGPLTTPIGGGIRSLNVALRQQLDLYVCLRPVRWFKGVPSPVKRPDKVDMVIFRENTEDIYAGIEYEAGSESGQEGPRLPREASSPRSSRRSASGRDRAASAGRSSSAIGAAAQGTEVGIGIKPVSYLGTEYARVANRRKSVTLVHKGNIMKFTEGRLP